jgi:hypothetical protein
MTLEVLVKYLNFLRLHHFRRYLHFPLAFIDVILRKISGCLNQGLIIFTENTLILLRQKTMDQSSDQLRSEQATEMSALIALANRAKLKKREDENRIIAEAVRQAKL